ncbi:MAG: cysteate synthase [Lentisphaerae bacterium RIFOXYB12_FULL_65_16]|nr:MAG: cysteate synthase [Lentisphaerae bacterium RIFOXYA12_64_32]OGV84658.1 MAG: cysteate synthase [Lentisphaerae bacterium RIFOXYB12_FULL_65_16]
MLHYQLKCLGCGKAVDEAAAGFTLKCPDLHDPALLRAEYASRQMTPIPANPGLFRYADWLPVRRVLPCTTMPVVYRSSRLAKRLGLDALFVAFSGYWPEKQAQIATCSFKELEAPAVLARLPENESRTLVVASAGNTGRAFLQVASQVNARVLVVVPEFALPAMWLTVPKGPQVRLAVLRHADYFDAIRLADLIAGLEGYFTEGATRNVARRDGMGTVMLAAAEAIGTLPRHCVQAVSSGSGAIAVWEASLRLLADGRFGTHKPVLHLGQNVPFTPMTDAWQAGSRTLPQLEEAHARKLAMSVRAQVLGNRRPAYGLTGGVFDALTDTQGQMYAVRSEEAHRAGQLFSELEGIDLDPAAEVATAVLLSAVESGRFRRDETVLLNVTGGGYRRVEALGLRHVLKPDLTFSPEEANRDTVARRLRSRPAPRG